MSGRVSRISAMQRQSNIMTLLGTLSLLCMMLLNLRTVEAETIGQMIQTDCPGGTEIKTLEGASREKVALHEPGSEVTMKTIARLYFRCKESTTKPYVRDWALYFYAINLAGSEKSTSDEWLPVLRIAVDALNDLAYRSRFLDVRQAALASRDQEKHTYIAVYQIKFGSAPPDVSEPAPRSQNPGAASPTSTLPTNIDRTSGQSLYQSTCASCHGVKGQGGSGPQLRGESALRVIKAIESPDGSNV